VHIGHTETCGIDFDEDVVGTRDWDGHVNDGDVKVGALIDDDAGFAVGGDGEGRSGVSYFRSHGEDTELES